MPGFSTRTFFAFADPILRIPTLLYLAGVPADLTPAIRWKDSRASAAGTTAKTGRGWRWRSSGSLVFTLPACVEPRTLIDLMPEGHTIHRHARMHTAELGGQRLAVSSPQGWASEAAQAVDGKVLEHVDAYGKHLLYRFEDDLSVHVHLGLFGGFRRYKLPGPARARDHPAALPGRRARHGPGRRRDLAADRPGRGGRADGAAGPRPAAPPRPRRPHARRAGPAQGPDRRARCWTRA